MALNTNTIQPGKPFYAFEFAHIVIFFSALFFIMQSILMMACSKSLKKEIDYICAEPIPNILSNYHNFGYRAFGSWFHTKKYYYNDCRYHMELKLLQHFFLDMYALDGFDFASYLHTCFDEQFLELCEVDPVSWAVFIFLCIANLVRYYVMEAIRNHLAGDAGGGGGGGGQHDGTTDGHSNGGGDDDVEPVPHGEGDHRHLFDFNTYSFPSTYDSLKSGFSSDADAKSSFVAPPFLSRVLGGGSTVYIPSTGANCTGTYVAMNNAISEETMFLFSSVSWVLLFVCVWLYFAVRNVELKLLSVAGCEDTFEYENKLEILQDKIIQSNKKLLSLSDDDAEIVRIKREQDAVKREALKKRTSQYREDEVEKQQLEDIKREEQAVNITRVLRTTVSATMNAGAMKMLARRLSTGDAAIAPNSAAKEQIKNAPSSSAREISFSSFPGIQKSLSSALAGPLLARPAGLMGPLEPTVPEWLKEEIAKSPVPNNNNGRKQSLQVVEFFKGLEQTDAIAEFEKRHNIQKHVSSQRMLEGGNAVIQEGEDGDEGDSDADSDDDEHDSAEHDGAAPVAPARGHGRSSVGATTKSEGGGRHSHKDGPEGRVSPPTSSGAGGLPPRINRQSSSGKAGAYALGKGESAIGSRHGEGGKHGAAAEHHHHREERGTMSAMNNRKLSEGHIRAVDLKSKGSESKLEAMYNRNEGIDLRVIYPFKNKHILKRLLDILLLINCLYLAMVASNFAIVNVDKGYDKFGGYYWGHVVFDLLMIGPSLVQIPIIYMIVRTNNIISAIADLDIEIVSEVIENTEEMAELEFEVFQIIRERLKALGAEKPFLMKVFNSIDTDANGTLDFEELRMALVKMGVHLSKVKYRSLFRILDQSKTGSITFPQFHNLIFPEDEVREKVKSDELAMRSHDKKKTQFLSKEQTDYDHTFEGMLQSGAKGMQQHELDLHNKARTDGILNEKKEVAITKEREKIKSLQSGRLKVNPNNSNDGMPLKGPPNGTQQSSQKIGATRTQENMTLSSPDPFENL